MSRKVLTFVLAGGRGERLDPLTRDRAKPAVPFGGIYRIIDFTLSNCVNSDMRRIYVLTQYKSFSLQKHLLAGWDVVSSQLGEFIDVIPAQQRISDDWYLGTADAIYQNIYTIKDMSPAFILILAGDHIYQMDYREMVQLHKEKEADVTVACVRMPKETSASFGVLEVDKKNNIKGFQEKPEKPKTIPGSPKEIFASMGIYLFKRDSLISELQADSQTKESQHDFGKNVIPQMIEHNKKVCAYNFVDDLNQPKYWRDIGTRDAYYQANMDLLREDSPFDLFDKSWPVRTFHAQYPPVKVKTSKSGGGIIINSMLSGGCVIQDGHVEHSVLSPMVKIGNGAEVKNSVIMEGVVVGEKAKIQNAIIDKEVVIPPKAKIGYNLSSDKKNFAVTASGVVIAAKKTSLSS